ncbi:O-antigen ligase family protein [Sphingomonas sp. BK235]|uniref:O-antigen ligase family protein n=1 Tax=Sphingomonas sp. BK235 TaxID=2512131 RepID=UPI0010540C03|nr:O-antigen ligase family protein [Sphingomonas sp. BK235]TCP36097.1 O-antigen ligase-like membrane protein [Sphingomonas sp. BK235]
MTESDPFRAEIDATGELRPGMAHLLTRNDVRRAYAVGISIGLLLTLFVLVDLVFRPSFQAISVDSEVTTRSTPAIVTILHFSFTAALAFPCVWALNRSNLNLRRVGNFAFVSLGLVSISALSLLGHPDASAIALVGVLAFVLTVVIVYAATNYDLSSAMEGFWTALAIAGAVALLGVVAVGEYSWGRLASHASPNYWGRVAFAALCGCVCVRRLPLRVFVVVISVIVLLLTSSRGSMLAALVGAIILLGLLLRKATGIMLGVYIVGSLLALTASPIVLDSVFHLSDPRRGVSSGGTGRSLAWAQAWEAFTANPWLGIGFRQHEKYITVASSAHEAYLATLAEIGIIGFMFYLLLVVGGAMRAILHAMRNGATSGDVATAMFMSGFVVLGLIETQALTTASPTSLTMFFAAASAWRPFPTQELIIRGYPR